MATISEESVCDDLKSELAIDAAAGIVAAVLVTPVVTIMDRMVVERSCNSRPLLPSFKKHLADALKQPRRFATSRPTMLVFALYFGTFATANTTLTLSNPQHLNLESAATRTATTLSTLSINVPLGIYKDTVFSKLFGCAVLPTHHPSQILPRTPPSTYLVFLLRDFITIYTSFALPGIVSSLVPNSIVSNPQSKAAMTQLAIPALGQVANTPIHLIGLEIYNRQAHYKISDLTRVIRKDFITASVTRICRIIPAFGLGTLTNSHIRESLHSYGMQSADFA